MNRTCEGEREGDYGNSSFFLNARVTPHGKQNAVCPFHERHAIFHISIPRSVSSVTYVQQEAESGSVAGLAVAHRAHTRTHTRAHTDLHTQTHTNTHKHTQLLPT